jgi:hypothetical protein
VDTGQVLDRGPVRELLGSQVDVYLTQILNGASVPGPEAVEKVHMGHKGVGAGQTSWFGASPSFPTPTVAETIVLWRQVALQHVLMRTV